MSIGINTELHTGIYRLLLHILELVEYWNTIMQFVLLEDNTVIMEYCKTTGYNMEHIVRRKENTKRRKIGMIRDLNEARKLTWKIRS